MGDDERARARVGEAAPTVGVLSDGPGLAITREQWMDGSSVTGAW